VADEPTWEDIFAVQNSSEELASAPEQKQQTPQPDSASPSVTASEAAKPKSRRDLREKEGTRSIEDDQPPKKPAGYGKPQRKRRRFGWLVWLLVIVVVIGGGGTGVYLTFQSQIQGIFGAQPSADYTGSGTGKVIVTIKNGQIGSDVAAVLHLAGVTKTTAVFYKLLLTQTPTVNFQPGSYSLRSHMSAVAALSALRDPKNKVSAQIVLPEGITLKQVIAKLAAVSQVTGVSQIELETAAADYKSYGLPVQAPSLEGYLFPATYTLGPGHTAHQIFQTFVTEMFSRLDAAGVTVADRNRVLTLAALTQKEGGSVADFYKVARVWNNRIAKGMNLQSDATVAYGAGGTSIQTTPAQRANKGNLYNTYANPGLPIGPISNPGDKAIDATLHPAVGTWVYFVVVNCSTGETAFSDTLAQHNAANAQLGKWLKANPGGCN